MSSAKKNDHGYSQDTPLATQTSQHHRVQCWEGGREGGREEKKRKTEGEEKEKEGRKDEPEDRKEYLGRGGLRAPDDVVSSHNQFVHQHTEGVWPRVLDKTPSMLVGGRQSKKVHNKYACM